MNDREVFTMVPKFLSVAQVRHAFAGELNSCLEASAALVRAPDFKSGGECGDTLPAGSIPVRFRQFRFAWEVELTDELRVQVSFKDMESNEGVRNHIELRCAALSEEFPEIHRFEITLAPDGSGHTAHGEVTSQLGPIATHAAAIEMSQAADRLLIKLERQLRKNHDKRIFVNRRKAQKSSPKSD